MATQFIQTISKFKVCISLLLVLCIGVGNTHAQDKKSKVRVTLKYIVTNNSDKQLVATVKSKIGRSYKGIENITVAFTVKGTDTVINMGNTVSDQNGIATLQVDAPKLEALNIPAYNFTATALENASYLSKAKSITANDSKLELKFEKQDSLNMVNIQFKEKDSVNQFTGVKGIGVKLYVKRLFGNLPIETDYSKTNSNGKVNLEFPHDIKGGEQGVITIIAQVEGDDKYGTIQFKEDVNWGIPLELDHLETKRELWTARANTPIYLLVLINGMILGVWGSIVYLVLQIFKIRKLGKAEL